MVISRVNSNDIHERQTQVLVDIKQGNCTISCAAALNDDMSCHCRCGGLNHGALWLDIVVVSYESEV